MKQLRSVWKSSLFSGLGLGIILLTTATGLIHLYVGIRDNYLLLILNGLGYLVQIIALYLPSLQRYHGGLRLLLIGYASLTLILWIPLGSREGIAYITKLIEIVLIVLLWRSGIEGEQAGPSGSGKTAHGQE